MTIDYERKRRNIEKCLIEEGKLITVQNLIRETTFDNQKIASIAAVEESVVRRARSEIIRV